MYIKIQFLYKWNLNLKTSNLLHFIIYPFSIANIFFLRLRVEKFCLSYGEQGSMKLIRL